jgi:hypothetical protein
MNRFSVVMLTTVGVALFSAVGCSSETASPPEDQGEAPAVQEGDLAPKTVSENGYAITAHTPWASPFEWPEGSGNTYYDVQASAEATGGGTYPRGLCIISQYGPASSCSGFGWNPSGGYYCVDGTVWTKGSGWCAGTPADGQWVGPGYLYTSVLPGFGNGLYKWRFRTFACVNGTNCEASPYMELW